MEKTLTTKENVDSDTEDLVRADKWRWPKSVCLQ